MKTFGEEKLFRLFILSILISFSVPISIYASNYKGFIVEKVGSPKILINDGYSQYLIEHDYDCYDSDFHEGETIYIDTYYSPAYGDKIIISNYSNTVCEITASDDVNIKQYYVEDVSDSKDEIIIQDKKGYRYLVEYGIGCLSMWRYENKNIDIDIGGSFLDGISDRIYLFNSDDDCKVWNAEELNSGDSSNYYGGYSETTKTITCPINSSNVSGQCICNNGYKANSAGTGCELPLTCSANSSLGSDNKCYCNSGYANSGNTCITYDQNCQNKYGPNSYGDKNYCYCSSGYKFNESRTSCIIEETKIDKPESVATITPEKNKTENVITKNNSETKKEVSTPKASQEQNDKKDETFLDKVVIKDISKEDFSEIKNTEIKSKEEIEEPEQSNQNFIKNTFTSIKNIFQKSFKWFKDIFI